MRAKPSQHMSRPYRDTTTLQVAPRLLSGYQPLNTFIHAGYSPKAISLLVASSNFPAGSAPQTLARSLAYVRDVMGRRLEDIKPAVVVLKSVPRNLAPRYTALHKVYVWCGRGAGGGCGNGQWLY
jgi:hypothetical protein